MDVKRLIRVARSQIKKEDGPERYPAHPNALPIAMIFSALRDLCYRATVKSHRESQRSIVEAYPLAFRRDFPISGTDRQRRLAVSTRMMSLYPESRFPEADKEKRRYVAGLVVAYEYRAIGVNWLLFDNDAPIPAWMCFDAVGIEFDKAREELRALRGSMWIKHPHRVWLSDEWMNWAKAL